MGCSADASLLVHQNLLLYSARFRAIGADPLGTKKDLAKSYMNAL